MEQQQEVLKAYKLMCTARAMADIYEANRNICTYVHSTSKGHEAIQLATAFQLQHFDYVSPYYRDESLLLGLGFTPFQLMCQLLAKGTDEFSGGRTYYSHPSFKTDGVKPAIIHQSSATGMQAIPTTGVAQAVEYIANNNDIKNPWPHAANPVVVCSLGDNSVTEGEVAEAWQFAVLKQLPIIYLVQDNDWGISVTAAEARAMNAAEYAAGFKGMAVMEVDGSDFFASTQVMQQAFSYVRTQRKPLVVRATVPLLGHHTSGVRKEFYRTEDDLRTHAHRDPFVFLHSYLLQNGYSETLLQGLITEAKAAVANDFELAQQQPNPLPNTVEHHVFAPTAVTQETGTRVPANGEKTLMVDAALLAIEQIMQQHPEALLYGQDVGKRLGGVFREAATLGDKFGDARVFNTAIQEAYIVGSTVGMSALGLRPIVEVQFADYIYPGFNQLVTEISKSCYLSNGKFPVSMVLRVPTGAYGGGGPYHSGSVETTLLSIKGIKVVYPSNAADMFGLMKAAYYDPNPVVMLEHKGLYWSKVPGTDEAKAVLPAADYMLPLGKANLVQKADETAFATGQTVCVITYGMGVYWAKAAAKQLQNAIEIIDLRTLYPLDEEFIFERAKLHGKVLVLTEEAVNNSFAQALAFRIQEHCFSCLDAPVQAMGALNLPAIPIHVHLEAAMLPTPEKLVEKIKNLLAY